MPEITDRATKGAALTHNEMDANLKRGIRPKTTTYAVVISDNRDQIECNSATPFTVTLPDAFTILAASDSGDFYTIITNIGTANVTIARTGTDTISGATSVTLYPYESVMVQANSSGNGYNITHVGLGNLMTAGTFRGGTIWTSATDGAGSGLDADLLDGLQPATAATINTIMQRDASGNTYLEALYISESGANAGLLYADATHFGLQPYDDGAFQPARELAYIYADNRWQVETNLKLATNNNYLIGTTTGAADISLSGVDTVNRVRLADSSYACVINRSDPLIAGNATDVTNTAQIKLGYSNLTTVGRLGFVSAASDILFLLNDISGGEIQIRSGINNTARTILAGGVSAQSTAGAYISEEGNDYGGAGLGGDLHLVPGSVGQVLLYRGALAPQLLGSTTSDTTNLSLLEIGNSSATRRGYVGMFSAANSDIYLGTDVTNGNIRLAPNGAGVASVNGNTIWHTGNDGSGSGLDADLWDGNQFATYLNQTLLTTSSPVFAGLTVGGGSVLTNANTVIGNASDGGLHLSAVAVTFTATTSGTSYGPTGSGATNTWTALDGVPVGSTWILLAANITSAVFGTAAGNVGFYIYGKAAGTSPTDATIASARGYASGAGQSVSGLPTFLVVRLDASRRFEVWLSRTNTTDTAIYYLAGYGK